MKKISAVIITYNEENNIVRCIDSLKKVADEIIVVDSFSTDRTEELCKSMGISFHQRIWDNYSAQKNYGNKLTSNNYILSIDADEVLSNKLQESIIKEKWNLEFNAYSFNRLTFFCGKPIRHCGWYPDRKIRLWDKRKAKWEGEVHENLFFEENILEKHLEGDLLHYTSENLFSQIEKINKYTDTYSKNAITKGKKTTFFKLLFKPPFKFFQVYILKLGIMDGLEGFLISCLSAIDSFLRLSKIKFENRNQTNVH